MKIFATNTNSYNSNKNPSFRGVEHFDYVKKLEGMVCAVCGRKTLPSDTFVKINTPNCKPLLYNMQKQAMRFFEERFPSIWALLVRYTEQYPEQSLDTIMEKSEHYIELKQEISNQICQERGFINPTDSDKTRVDRSVGATFFDLLESARTYLEPASVVMKNLASLKCFLTEEQRKAYEILEGYAQKFPDKTLSEIVNMEEVYTYHTEQARIKEEKLLNRLHLSIDSIHSMITEESPDAISHLFSKKNSIITMFKETADPDERMYNLKEIYRYTLTHNNCEHLSEKVFAEIDKIPKTFMTADAFLAFAHRHNYTDGKIIAELFNSNFTTEEHLDTVAEGGEDKIENKIVMHKSCNQHRNRIPYPKFLKYHPNMQENVQKQVDLVVDALLKGELPYFTEFYPLKMPLKLAEKTDGLISIDITRYCREGLNLSYKKEARFREELYNISNLRDKKIVEKMKNKGPNPELDAEIKFLHSEIFRIKESIKIEGKKRYRMQEYLKSQDNNNEYNKN